MVDAASPTLAPTTSPWGKVSPAAPQDPSPAKSFHELMSEDLAKEMQQKYVCVCLCGCMYDIMLLHVSSSCIICKKSSYE